MPAPRSLRTPRFVLSAMALLALLNFACGAESSTQDPDAGSTTADGASPADLGPSTRDASPPSGADAEPRDQGAPTDAGQETSDAGQEISDVGPGADAGSGSDAGPTGGLPSATASHVAVGRVHACAVTSGGQVRCWGAADYGQLGNGVIDGTSAGLYSAPVEVMGINSGATDVSSFADHTCAIVASGARCWGANADGQLGNGGALTSAQPVSVQLPAAFTPAQVVTGEAFSCARSSAGAVMCWGKNDYGQLGNGDAPNGSAVPVEVTGLAADVRSIAAGATHACAALNSGEVRCWGSNLYGEQGNGTYGSGADVPGVVQGLGTVDAVIVGAGQNFSCLASSAGAAYCWGRNYDGQLGNGASGFDADQLLPVAVQGLGSGTTMISGGYGFACAAVNGAALCWGSNVNLVLGHGGSPSDASAVPVPVVGLGAGTTAVAATSSDHACAVSNGSVFCWGSAGPFLGNGDPITNAATPTPVLSLP